MTPGGTNEESSAERAARLFERRFGSTPTVAHAPGRVNLIGEHVDYLEGVVLPLAIDRRAAVAIGESSDGRTRIVAADLDREYEADGPPPPHPVEDQHDAFANHVLGVIEASGGVEEPLSILVTSDVPSGAGVSSSAAIEVAVGACLAARRGVAAPDPLRLATDARTAEHEFVGTPCGIMDMLVSAAATRDAALRIDCRTLDFEPVPLPPRDQLAILLVDSGVAHRLADGGYADRRAACERVVAAVGRSLRDVDRETVEQASLDPVDRRRALHVVDEIARVDAAIAAIDRGDLAGLGAILLEGHASLRDLFEVSVPELDAIVETVAGLRDHGCFGARMTGGGFGGSAIVLLSPDAIEDTMKCIESDFESRFGRRASWMRVEASDGARID